MNFGRAGTVPRPYVIILLVFIFGTWMRFHALDRQSLWDDEMSTIRTVSFGTRNLFDRLAVLDMHPPLYFLQLEAWRHVGGHSLVRLRANSAFWGMLGLIGIFGLGEFYYGAIGGLLALAFLAFSPFHLAYSQEARSYTMVIALALFSWWLVELQVQKEHEPTRARWVALCVLWAALPYTHYWGGFVVLAQALYIFWRDRAGRFRKAFLGTLAVSSAAFAFWLPIWHGQLQHLSESFWVDAFSIRTLAKSFAAFSGLYFHMASNQFYIPTTVGVTIFFGIVLATVWVLGIEKGPAAAKFWLAVGLGVPWLLSAWKPPIYVWYRYTSIMLPAFILLVVAGLFSIKSRWLRILVAGICLTSQLWACRVYFTTWVKANPKAVVQYIHWMRKPDTVVIRPAYFADLFNFYDQGTLPTVDEHVLDSAEKRARLKGKDVLLLVFDVPSDPIAEAMLAEFHPLSGRYFPGFAHLGITVYHLK